MVQDRSYLLGELARAETYTQVLDPISALKPSCTVQACLNLSAFGATLCIDRRLRTMALPCSFAFVEISSI